MPDFSHLHVHTQFSLLDGAADIKKLFKKASKDGMKALAITDHGNMFGAFKFVAEAGKHGVKPIVGCEFYVVNDRHKRSFTKDDRDVRYHQLLLAKNATGYKNLVKLCSLGYVEGLYGKYPRIDKELILKYHEGLIATTCCIGAMVPKTILRKGEKEAEQEFKWWLDLFGEDYYIELQRHKMQDQEKVNQVLLGFAQKYNVKVIASNDSHYVDREDSNAHDILLCINTGEKQSTPTNKEFSDDDSFVKGTRFAFYNDEFYFKTQSEMNALFSDIPEAIDNTNEIVDKIDTLKLKQDILLPNFVIPSNFNSQDEYLRHITFEGAYKRYETLTAEIEERLNFELFTIETMGFAGYFLIVADFIKAGRDIGVFVGPGRGSAAGSAVAYCIGITNIDPIKYNLLFERFLNPERKSMPDIDTDFDDEGRQKVIDYVVDKYGKNQVAQIVTYGTMAAKMSIKDVARVMDLPLPEANALAKLVPDKPGTELNRVILANIDGEGGLKDKEGYQQEDLDNIKQLRAIYNDANDFKSKVLKEAVILEGSVRGTGIHAAGIIIAPKDLTDIIPVATSKDTDLLITQYDGKVIEDAGVIKMDFLGLKTLTIIRDALALIKQNKGIDIDIDNIPLDDAKTFELYQRGETNGTFQFESAGMQKHLIDLKPDKFEDLIAMNALYRPGPMQYIPKYIARKHGREQVTYDLPEMEEYLQDTNGITVYQEQVMLLSQKLSGFSKGQADTLRKAMGKKDRKMLDDLKDLFITGAVERGLEKKKLEKVWTDWEAFASYAFNKSHSTCYAFVAFQTAYLKANYPSEYMAAVLTHNLSNIDKITFFMEECRRMGMSVLGPDINESIYKFSVNESGKIRFGLGAVKGVGEAAVQSIIDERNANGKFSSIFDLVKRVNLRTANKKTFESLAYAGAFDSFGLHRAIYFYQEPNENGNFLEKLIRFGANFQDSLNSAQNSLFGSGVAAQIPEPKIPVCEEWGFLQKLRFEKEVVGFYISGHPLDEFKFDLEKFCTASVNDLRLISKFSANKFETNNGAEKEEENTDDSAIESQNERFERLKNKELSIGGMVSSANHRIAKSGKPYGSFLFEDYSEQFEITLFGDDYLKFKPYLNEGLFLYLKGRVQERYGKKGDWEFKVNNVQLLTDVRDKLTKSMTITCYLSDLNEQLLGSIVEIIETNSKTDLQKNCELKIKVVDQEQGISMEMPSRKCKVSPTNELLQALEQLKGISFRLN